MSIAVTILGCGSSGGVPRITGEWGLCDPENPKNRRRRCSVLLEQAGPKGVTRVLIDTSPDLRDQILDTGIRDIDGVWYTHEHADHTHGIDELRGFYINSKRCVPVWADANTLAMLTSRFPYCFSQLAGSDYPAILASHIIQPGIWFETQGAGGTLSGLPIELTHGAVNALGFRVGNIAYTPDVNSISETAAMQLAHLDLWIVDALRRNKHPSHFSLLETLEWIARLKPKQAVLTNMHNDMDYATLRQELPASVLPAYDGMRVVLDGTSIYIP